MCWPCVMSTFNSPIKIGYIIITVPTFVRVLTKEKVSTRVIFKELNQFCLKQFVLFTCDDHSTKCKEIRQFINSMTQLLKETARFILIVVA